MTLHPFWSTRTMPAAIDEISPTWRIKRRPCYTQHDTPWKRDWNMTEYRFILPHRARDAYARLSCSLTTHSGLASGRNARTVVPALQISWSLISFSSRPRSSRYVLRPLNSRTLRVSVPSFTELYTASNTGRFTFSKMGAQSSAPRRAVVEQA